MDGSTSSSTYRYSPIRQESELRLTHQNSSSVFAETLTPHNMNNSFPAQTLTHQMNNSFPAQTSTHRMNSSFPAQIPTHQMNSSFPAQTPTHQMNNSLPAHTLTHEMNNSFPAQKLSSWKQLKELKDTRRPKSATHDSLFLIPDDQGQCFHPGHRSIIARQSDGIHGEDSISRLCGKADDRELYDSLDNSQTKEHNTSLREDVKLVYKGDIANSKYNVPSNLSAHSDNNISCITVRNSKFLEGCQMKVSKWQSEMMNKSFCLNETRSKPNINLRMNKAGCQSNNYLHSKRIVCQSHSDLNLNKTDCPSHNDLLLNKSYRRSLNGLHVNTNSQPEKNLCNLLVQTESDLPKSYQLSGSFSGNTKMSSLSSELLHFKQQRRSCTNHEEQNKTITTSPFKLNSAASQNIMNNMWDVNIHNESMNNAEKNIKNSSPLICDGIKENKYNNVRYMYVHDLDTHSDKFYFNSRAKTCSNNRSQCWEGTLSNISSLKTDVQATSMTTDSLITGTYFPRTEHEQFVDGSRTCVWSNRQMIDLGCNVTLLRDEELINSNLNAKECGDAPSDYKESSPLNHKSNRLLFLDYLLKSEAKKSRKPKRSNVKKPRQIYKESILNQRKNKDGFLKGILSVMQMKPSAKANISEKRGKNITNVKSIVTNARMLPFDDSKSTPNIFVNSKAITTTTSKSDNSHSTSSASFSLDSLQSYTSKESSEDISNNSSALDQKLDLKSSKKYTYKPSPEMKPYDIGTVSNQYIKGCLFLNKVLTDNFNLLQLCACNGEPQSSETEARIESNYLKDDKDIILNEEKSSQSTTSASSNSESMDELVESLSTHTPEIANVTCKDYIIEIMGNTIISESNNMYMTSIFKSVNKNTPITLLEDTEEQPDIEKTSKKTIECAFPLALRAGKTPVNSIVTFGKVQNGPSEKSLDPISVLGPCYDSETEKTKSSSTGQTSTRTLATKPKGPFVCNPSRTAFQLQPHKYLCQKPRPYQCFSISKSRIGPCFKRFPNRPQRTMPTTALPLTTVTVQRNERRNTLGWHDQVKICESPKHKSNITAIPAPNSSRIRKRKTWMGASKNRKHTPSSKRSHSKGIKVIPAGLVGVRNQCPSTGHFLGHINKAATAPKCVSLIVRHYRIGAKCKSVYSRNPRIVIARPLGNSKKNACTKIESNRYSRSHTPGNVKSTTYTAKSHAPRAFSASGQSEPLKNARGISKSSTPRSDPLKSSDGMNEKSKNAQCDKSKPSKKKCDNYPQQHVATETKLRDANRPASNSMCENKPLKNTCKAILFPEARRQDVTPVSIAKIPNFIPDIPSLKENQDSRNVFSRLWVSHSKCIGDVSSICCQLLSDIKQNSASYGFCENDVKCLWMLNKQFKCKDSNNKAKKAGTEIVRTGYSPKNKKHSEIDIISNYKGVISCIRAIISKQNVSLRAIDDVIQILETEESAANTSAKNMPLEVSKSFISSKEKLKDCAPRQGNSHCSKNRSLKDRNKSVCFNDDVPRCHLESAHRQQCNLRTEQLSGNCSKCKSTQQDKVIVSSELAPNTEQCTSRCSRFYRSPFTLCGDGCDN